MSCDLRRSRLGTFLGLGTKRVALVTPLCLQFSTDEATTGSPTPGLVSHPSLCEHTHSLTHLQPIMREQLSQQRIPLRPVARPHSLPSVRDEIDTQRMSGGLRV